MTRTHRQTHKRILQFIDSTSPEAGPVNDRSPGVWLSIFFSGASRPGLAGAENSLALPLSRLPAVWTTGDLVTYSFTVFTVYS